MPEAFIYDAVRTPRGKGRENGGLNSVSPIKLAATALRAIAERNDLSDTAPDDVVLGCVEPVDEQAADIARLAVLESGLSENVPGVQINRFCASGLEACNMAAAQVMSGQADAAIGGGVESMSRVTMYKAGVPWLTDPDLVIDHNLVPQGISADLIATKWGYSRSDLDAYAVESQKRTEHARSAGYFAPSIVPVRDRTGSVVLEEDEHPRPGATLESLGQLAPAFEKLGQSGYDAMCLEKYPDIAQIEHVHHAGNSSGIVDGAAAVLIGSDGFGARIGQKPRARIRSFASVGSEPTIMLTGPEFAAEKALARAGMSVADIDLFEVNEAFAAVPLRFMEALGVEHQKVNVNGGAIAMGHPLGATGAMLLGIALDELERSGKGTALITLCVAAGMGTATIIERL